MIRNIYIAGGCFWGLEELMRNRPGVVDTEVGYMGGVVKNPTYENHKGHAEALRLTYDDTVTTYEDLLLYFFRIHDPTTLNSQGNDYGDSYRSAIFYQDEVELMKAKQIIERVNESKMYKDKVVTTLEEYDMFYPAEEYHQDYLRKNPGGYTCHYERSGIL